MITQATLGAGCFWGVEEKLRTVNFVMKTRVGFMGGKLKNPTYEEVCSGTTGHIEVVEVTFDNVKLRYEDLLDVFWKIHNPTLVDQQGSDIGSQYRSVIFYHSEEQKKKAFLSKLKLEKTKKYKEPIVTDIRKAAEFYPAEEYHQKYLLKKQREATLKGKSDSLCEKNTCSSQTAPVL